MSTSEKYQHYSAGDIQKYLAGELSAGEMHALERAALEDPLLADALDGMERDRGLHNEEAFRTDLQELHARLADRVAKKNKGMLIPLGRAWWKIAAAAVLVTGMGLLSYRYLLNGGGNGGANDRGKEELAARAPETKPTTGAKPITEAKPATQTIPATPGRVAADSVEISASSSTLSNTLVETRTEPVKDHKEKEAAGRGLASARRLLPAVTIPPADQERPVARILSKEEMQERAAKAYKNNNRMDSLQLSFTPTAKYVADSLKFGAADQAYSKADTKAFKKGTDRNPEPGSNNAGFLANRSALSNNAANYIFIGKVIDSNNRPIPFATISINNRQQTASADHNGNFSFQLLGSPDSLAPVLVSSVGYHSTRLTLNAFTSNNNNAFSNVVRLQPENQSFSDVVTIGYGTQRKANGKKTMNYANKDRDKATDTTDLLGMTRENKIVQRAAPVAGWTAYQNYLRKNKPASGIDSGIKGNEIISFQVDRKGRLSSFKVEQSLSPAHDSLLINLVRKGPAWKPLEGKKAGAIVTMSF